MHGELGFDLKAAGQRGKGFHEPSAEHAIAREHVGERLPEHMGDKSAQQPIAGAMAGPVGRLLAVDPDGANHVEPLAQQHVDHGAGARRIVGGVAVDQHVDVGVDVGEHAAHHVAFALPQLTAGDGAGLRRHFDGAVAGIVVIDVDVGVRQRGAEISHHLADGGFLVVARHQHRNPVAADDVGRGLRAAFG